MRPSTVLTNGTITASDTFWFVHCNVPYNNNISSDAMATLNAVDSALPVLLV